MKHIIIILFALASALCFTGCYSLTSGTGPALQIQNALTNILPPDFSGDIHIAHVNPYFNFGIDAQNVHKDVAGKWTWDGLQYNRADMFHTTGDIKLTPRAQPVPAPAPAVKTL